MQRHNPRTPQEWEYQLAQTARSNPGWGWTLQAVHSAANYPIAPHAVERYARVIRRDANTAEEILRESLASVLSIPDRAITRRGRVMLVTEIAERGDYVAAYNIGDTWYVSIITRGVQDMPLEDYEGTTGNIVDASPPRQLPPMQQLPPKQNRDTV